MAFALIFKFRPHVHTAGDLINPETTKLENEYSTSQFLRTRLPVKIRALHFLQLGAHI